MIDTLFKIFLKAPHYSLRRFSLNTLGALDLTEAHHIGGCERLHPPSCLTIPRVLLAPLAWRYKTLSLPLYHFCVILSPLTPSPAWVLVLRSLQLIVKSYFKVRVTQVVPLAVASEEREVSGS